MIEPIVWVADEDEWQADTDPVVIVERGKRETEAAPRAEEISASAGSSEPGRTHPRETLLPTFGAGARSRRP